MIMGKTQELPKFSCDNTAIPITNEIELLGVTVDDKLKFENRIRKLCRKVSHQTAVLQRMKKMLPFEMKRDLYFAFILPHFKYCAEMWHHCSKKCTSMLEKVNERAVRFIFNDRFTPYRELLKKLGLTTLLNQRLLKIVCTVFKTLNRPEAPRSIQDLINRRLTTLGDKTYSTTTTESQHNYIQTANMETLSLNTLEQATE